MTEFVRQVVAARKFLGLLRRLGRASAVQTLRSLDAPRGGERSADSAHRRVGAPQTARTADRAHRRVGRSADRVCRRADAPQTERAAGRTFRRQHRTLRSSAPQTDGRSAGRRALRRLNAPQRQALRLVSRSAGAGFGNGGFVTKFVEKTKVVRDKLDGTKT